MMKHLIRNPLRLFTSSIACLAFLALLSGCATEGNSSAGAAVAGPGSTSVSERNAVMQSVDTLRVGELLLVEFSGVTVPPPRHEERIKADGHITLPSVGPIEAAGKTRGELEQAIHDAYVPNYYRALTVTIRNEGRFFYVKGQVKNPNQFQYLKEMTVLKAIAAAGDFTDFAKKKEVLLTRANGQKLTVNCIKAMHDQKLDLPVYPDDTIEVPRRYF